MSGLLAGISVTCFAASYALAAALEWARLAVHVRARAVFALGFAAAGFLAHTLFLGHRAAVASAAPLSSSFDWYLLAAWLLVVAYLYLVVMFPRRAIGLFLWPIVLLLILAAAVFASREPIAPEPASRSWGMVHGWFLLLGSVAVLLGFVAGLMYLVQAYRLKHKQLPAAGLRLPSLEWLEHVNLRLLYCSTILISIGFVAGLVLKAVRAEPLFAWADPVEVVLGVVVVWLATATAFAAFYRPARHGRKVAYLSLGSFALVCVLLAVMLFGPGDRHGGKPAGLSGAAAIGVPSERGAAP